MGGLKPASDDTHTGYATHESITDEYVTTLEPDLGSKQSGPQEAAQPVE
jgi:hypothetical protein